jgi:hypothetical protein
MMTTPMGQVDESYSYIEAVGRIICSWGPYTIAACIGGYYGLGVAYEYGVMAAIDKVAMSILKDQVGYVGMGALMPTVQWYSALAVRTVCAITAGLIYDMIAKIVLFFYDFLCEFKNSLLGKESTPAP